MIWIDKEIIVTLLSISQAGAKDTLLWRQHHKGNPVSVKHSEGELLELHSQFRGKSLQSMQRQP